MFEKAGLARQRLVRKPRVLLAIRDAAMVEGLSYSLPHPEFDFSLITQPFEACRHLSDHRFDVFVLDLDSAEDRAQALLDAVAAAVADAPPPPCLILLGSPTLFHITLPEELEVDRFLCKPMDAQQLLKAVAEAARGEKAPRQSNGSRALEHAAAAKLMDPNLLQITLERVLERKALQERNAALEQELVRSEIDTQLTQTALRGLTSILRGQSTVSDFPQTSLDILRLIHELLKSRQSAICVRVGELPVIYHLPTWGESASIQAELDRVLGWVIATNEGLVNAKPMRGEHTVPSRFAEILPSSIVFPIHTDSTAFGALLVSRSLNVPRFSDYEIQLLELVCEELSILSSNARLHESYERMALGAVTALSNTVEHRDAGTARHLRRSQEYVERIFEALGLTRAEREAVCFAMRLHDIGKIRVPRRIINKSGPLTEQEWQIMRMHPVWGHDILNSEGMLSEVALLVKYHHERFDGTGYPEGLKGEGIPLGARILSIVDAFDAMHSDRPYRRAYPFEHSVREIRDNLGSQFDPRVGRVFLESLSAH